jgi:hypothetical protein
LEEEEEARVQQLKVATKITLYIILGWVDG